MNEVDAGRDGVDTDGSPRFQAWLHPPGGESRCWKGQPSDSLSSLSLSTMKFNQ